MKYDEFGDVEEMIVVDTKLSYGTALTSGQTAAKNYVGKGNLAYKPVKSATKDSMGDFLPKQLEQGDEIPIKGFYKLYGDGESVFKGIKEL